MKRKKLPSTFVLYLRQLHYFSPQNNGEICIETKLIVCVFSIHWLPIKIPGKNMEIIILSHAMHSEKIQWDYLKSPVLGKSLRISR